MKNENITVAVAMSGGVDSSLAAWILKKEGYSVVGITMAIFGEEACRGTVQGHACYGPGEKEDIRLAKEVSGFLGIAHHTVDLKEEYSKTVLKYFKKEYLKGRTPNPCTRCNPLLKFGLMPEKARQSGLAFDRFATGHYVRVCYDEGEKRPVLKKALDPKKDQSYFLYGLNPDLLPQLLFPLGNLTKEEVRKRAESIRLPVSERPESQDFIEGGDYSNLFTKKQIKPGPIMDLSGNRVGTHKGIISYTIGQRRGLGIAHSEPLYVVDIDPENNTLVVGPKHNLFSDTLIASNLNFLSTDRPAAPVRIEAKIRHNHKAAFALLTPLEGGRVKIVFDSPQLSITPGQSVVFYDGDVVLGGGIIEQAL
jgi:tRNA-specific 2-thiouridylase